jgi:hypothetical protein
MRAILAILALAVSARALPTLPGDWAAFVVQSLQMNEGGVSEPDGSQCCPLTAEECKIEVRGGRESGA